LKTVFRFNAGKQWGHGHIYRNLAIMNRMRQKGGVCYAVINDYEESKKALSSAGFLYSVVDLEEKPEDLISAINRLQLIASDTVIFYDRVNSEKGYYECLKRYGFKIVSYDDEGDFFTNSDIVIKTRPVVRENQKTIFAGFEYQVIRDEFLPYYERIKKVKIDNLKVLVHFGGTDPLHLMKKTYECIKELEDIETVFISGTGAYDDTLSEVINKNDRMQYVSVVENFAKSLFEADLAIISGGVTAFECGTVGTPMILIAQNEEQLLTQTLLEEQIGCLNLGIGNEKCFKHLLTNVKRILNNKQLRADMSRKEKEFFLPKGIDLICEIILKLGE
jgi:UDP-2,4-diacetamido-2,4,6-trideoxy-beta-L-altropyranose hydrolase